MEEKSRAKEIQDAEERDIAEEKTDAEEKVVADAKLAADEKNDAVGSENVRPVIYLIDDDPGSIMSIVRSIFPKIWQVEKEEGNETYICIFGNAETVTESSSPPWNQQDEEEFARKIEDDLWFLCYTWEEEQKSNGKELTEGDKFDKKVELVRGKVHMLYKSDDNNDLKEEYEKIYRIWTGNVTNQNQKENERKNYEEAEQEPKIQENAAKKAKALIDKMKIPERACVGLDLSLLWGDIERTLEENQPILSMQLYHMLRENHNCFLYSKYVMVEEFIKAWKDIYKKYFSKDEDPEIYQKNELSQKEITDEILKKLIGADSGQSEK